MSHLKSNDKMIINGACPGHNRASFMHGFQNNCRSCYPCGVAVPFETFVQVVEGQGHI